MSANATIAKYGVNQLVDESLIELDESFRIRDVNIESMESIRYVILKISNVTCAYEKKKFFS
jgi:hypothetical protein